MEMILLILVPQLLAFSVTAIVVFYAVRRMQWSERKKKWVFASVVAVLSYPQMVGDGVMVIFPLPNIVLLSIGLFSIKFAELFQWYMATWKFTLVSLPLTLAAARGLAALLFAKTSGLGQLHQESKTNKAVRYSLLFAGVLITAFSSIYALLLLLWRAGLGIAAVGFLPLLLGCVLIFIGFKMKPAISGKD